MFYIRPVSALGQKAALGAIERSLCISSSKKMIPTEIYNRPGIILILGNKNNNTPVATSFGLECLSMSLKQGNLKLNL